MRPDRETLLRLYETERMTTRAIGARYGVSKTEVLRWLIAQDVSRRAANCGLDNRGMVAPTRDDLVRLVHNEHMGYREIAALYDVHYTAVPFWLKKHGVPLPTVWETRRNGHEPVLPTEAEFKTLYDAGMPVERIARRFGVSGGVIRPLCEAYGITVRKRGWRGKGHIECGDGHFVSSSYERDVDEWLFAHSVPHEVEPKVPFGSSNRADFLANGWYIEVWGVTNRKAYRERAERKRTLYAEHNLPLIEVPESLFAEGASGDLNRTLEQCLESGHRPAPSRDMALFIAAPNSSA